MKKWTKVAIPVAAVAVLVGWYVFRPERLVVNRNVNETMPTAPGASSAQPLESGRFYSILLPTERYGNHLPDGRWDARSSFYELQHIKWP